MENVKIKSVIDTGKVYKDNPIIEIELEDGRKGSCFDKLAKEWQPGQEIGLDIKPGKEYEGVIKYYFNIPKQKQAGFVKKDWSFEKKKASLEFAIKACEIQVEKVSTENILALAGKFYEYLNS